MRWTSTKPGELAGGFVDRLQHLDRRLLQVGVGARQVGLQRGAGAGVRRLQLQGLAVRGDRARAVGEMLLEDRAAAELQLGDRGEVGRQIDLLLDRRRQVLPAFELLIQAIQRRQRRDLRRDPGLEDLAVELDRLVGLLDLLLVEAGELEADLEPLGLVLRETQLLVVDREQVGEAAGRDVEPLERGDRVGILRRDLQDALVARDRRLGVGELPLVGARQRGQQRQRRGLLLDPGHGRLVGLDQLGPATALAPPAGARCSSAQSSSRRLGEAPAARSAARRPCRPPPRRAAPVSRCIRAGRSAASRRVRELDLQHVGQVPGVLGLLVERDQRLGGGQVLRRRARAPSRRPSARGPPCSADRDTARRSCSRGRCARRPLRSRPGARARARARPTCPAPA